MTTTQDTGRPPGVRLWLELSTAHLPPNLRSKTAVNAIDGVIAEDRTHGFMVWVPDDPIGHHADYDEDLPDVLMTVLLYARERDCDWVVFDRDADTVPDLLMWAED